MPKLHENLKVFYPRPNLEYYSPNKDIADILEWQSKRVKVKRLISKLKDIFSKLVQKNEEFSDLASKTEKPDSIYAVLKQRLDDVTRNNNVFLNAPISFLMQFTTKVREVLTLKVIRKLVCS